MKQFVAQTDSLVVNKKTLSKKRVLCSFSGGQDSTLVFFALFHKKKLSHSTNLLYFHHFWQIQNFQASRGIFYLSFNLRVPYTIIMSDQFLSNENRSRTWRKKNLFRLAHLQQSSLIISGHTQTDRLETNLNNLIRGTSSNGVSSLNWFGELGEAIFNIPQNSPLDRFSRRAFSTSSVFLGLLTQAKKVKSEKQIRRRSKIFFSKTTISPRETFSLILENKFDRKSNFTIDKSQNYNKYKFSQKRRWFPKFTNLGQPFPKFFKGTEMDKFEKIWEKEEQVFCIKPCWSWSKKRFFWIKHCSSQIFQIWEREIERKIEARNQILLLSKPQNIFSKKKFKGEQQVLQFQNKSNKFIFWKKKATSLFQNLEKNNLFYTCFRNRNYIRESNSFCFFKFSEKKTNKLKTPLKNQTRVTVLKLAKIYRLPLFQDLTNFSFHSSRNKIRHIVFPVLGSLFQKKIDFSFTQFFLTLSSNISECENSCQKNYFLLDFFYTSNVCSLKISKNLNTFSTELLLPKNEIGHSLSQICEILSQKLVFGIKFHKFGKDGDWVVFPTRAKKDVFEIFLLISIFENSEITYHSYVLKKIINNYTQRDLLYYQLRNIQKYLQYSKENFFYKQNQ